MNDYFGRFLLAMRPAFSRPATLAWFVIVVVGILMRSDTLGVSSIVRALGLAPHTYPGLVLFFHSTVWTVERVMAYWWKWQSHEPFVCRVGDRIVLVGDHTQTPKDGRKMPAVTTLHQDSETSSKPAFFRGHQWGCVSQLMTDRKKYWAAPLLAHIHQGLEPVEEAHPPATSLTLQMVHMAQRIAREMGEQAYLVLDAFFATGPVFREAAPEIEGESPRLHILTRAKKNVVAYLPYAGPQKPSGRHRIYGQK
ncbi:MAG: transposase [bacterium]